MNFELLKKVAGVIVTSTTIAGVLWVFAAPAVDAYIHQEIEVYIKSESYKIQERRIAEEISKKVFQDFLNTTEFRDMMDDYLNQANSNSVSLRKLLALKMEVPQESVADKLAELYTKDRKRLRNLLREINRMYPELNVWEIE